MVITDRGQLPIGFALMALAGLHPNWPSRIRQKRVLVNWSFSKSEYYPIRHPMSRDSSSEQHHLSVRLEARTSLEPMAHQW